MSSQNSLEALNLLADLLTLERKRNEAQNTFEVFVLGEKSQEQPNLVKDVKSLEMAFLKRLQIRRDLGYTPIEFEKDRVYLTADVGPKRLSSRVETFSMFLSRLVKKGYATKVKEGRTYRYFITPAGSRRLLYLLKKKEEQIEWCLSDSQTMAAFLEMNPKTIEMEEYELLIEGSSAILGKPGSAQVFSSWVKTLKETAQSIQELVFSTIIPKNREKHDHAVKKSKEAVQRLGKIAQQIAILRVALACS